MELMMFISNDCVDSVRIEQSFTTFPGYIGHFVKFLKRKNEQLLNETAAEPEFLLHGIPIHKSWQVIRMNSGPEPLTTKNLKEAI